MNSVVATVQAGGTVAAWAPAGPAVIVALCGLGILLLAVLCWTVANSKRTENMALIINAMRPTTKVAQDRIGPES